MKSDKKIKEEYRRVFWKHPERYYPVTVLQEEGFFRQWCKICGKPFWHVEKERGYCGDPACAPQESFGFIGRSPAKSPLVYLDVWRKFSSMFQKMGYTPIKRYPIVARWNPTMEFTNASIAAFQPYVVSGEAQPPANPLVIPQFCFRTTDIDNVGISGAHNTVFNMIGQHQFVPAAQWDQNKVFHDLHEWLRKGLGLPNGEITFIEDSWAGGGNLGCCMEFFSRGCELGNQVYMLYEQTPSGVHQLDLKVLDMGMGMERNAWFSQGTPTLYDATFPDVMERLMRVSGVTAKKSIIKSYVRYAGLLNIDETNNIQKAWHTVAKNVGVGTKELRDTVLPLAGLYSVAEHTRALLVLFTDGGLPSNVGDGYNLRVILRRALSFIDQYGWDVTLHEVMQWHAKALKAVFPEFLENFEDVHNILEHEEEKYQTTKQRSHQIISGLIAEKKPLDDKMLLHLYDSKGISPELIREEAAALGRKVVVPDNFYARVAELHEKREDTFRTARQDTIDFGTALPTRVLYYDDYRTMSFTATVVKQVGKCVLLDRTYFYPTSGGQLHDEGMIDGNKVVDVFKQGRLIAHVLGGDALFSPGQEVTCLIDKERRIQLAQHHTTAHILNAAARTVLGHHVNQASAHKDVDKGRLDITHYKGLSDEEVRIIEEEANAIVRRSIPMKKHFVERGRAEREYGVSIYQGGVVPGRELRIVEIPGVDVEACGGTHLNNTSEAGMIKIIKTSKISDSIVRIEYASGKAAQQMGRGEKKIVDDLVALLGVGRDYALGRVEEIFHLWKQVVKKNRQVSVTFSSGKSEYVDDEDLLRRCASVLKTQPEHVIKTLHRFLRDLEGTARKRS